MIALHHLTALMGKLNETCRGALEQAIGLSMLQTHYNVEVEHWLLKLVEPVDTDLAAILRYHEIDPARLSRELTAIVDRMKSGNSRQPGFSQHVLELVERAWLVASLDFGGHRIRSGHLLYALVADDDISRLARLPQELKRISAETLLKELRDLTAGTNEDLADAASAPGAAESSHAPITPDSPATPGSPTKTPSLDRFTIDLTQRARQGGIDPVLGRDAEIRQIIDILMRRRQNNPILTGEAGVGKTAVVEGLALRIAEGDVPPPLAGVALKTLDLSLLQAGAGVKGEFENRLKSVIQEVKNSPQPVILFIDEAHTLIGAGGQAGQGDAANLLKPALARGELRTIAATTWAEYKKYFENDAALARRFQVVKVEEPSETVAAMMMRGLAETLETHHRVHILDEAISEAARLSHRYISGRQLPDKAVSLLDTACARVAIGHSAVPPALEDCRRRIQQQETTLRILNREQATGSNHAERLAEATQIKATAEAELAELETQWNKERELVEKIRDLRRQLEPVGRNKLSAVPAAAAENPSSPQSLSAEQRQERLAELQRLNQQLLELQAEAPLLRICVDGQAIAAIVSEWTGIPVGRMLSDEINTIQSLRERMEQCVIGQSHALEEIAQRVRMSRANLTDPRRPIGVFLLVGPSGVGKTETAITLADLLYGGDQNMTVLNMSEFKEKTRVSMLMGTSAGYVGYGEGGVLTEAVRRRPYSVVLLDEMEKADPEVHDIFYQVFDKGILRDGQGRDIDFRNTVIIMTSNTGSDLIHKLCADPDTAPDPSTLAESLRPELLKVFKPAFLGRVSIVPYLPLGDEALRQVTVLQLGRIARRIRDNYRAEFTYAPELLSAITSRCREVDTGARNVDSILSRTMLPELASEFLGRLAAGQPVRSVHVTVRDDGGFAYQIS